MDMCSAPCIGAVQQQQQQQPTSYLYGAWREILSAWRRNCSPRTYGRSGPRLPALLVGGQQLRNPSRPALRGPRCPAGSRQCQQLPSTQLKAVPCLPTTAPSTSWMCWGYVIVVSDMQVSDGSHWKLYDADHHHGCEGRRYAMAIRAERNAMMMAVHVVATAEYHVHAWYCCNQNYSKRTMVTIINTQLTLSSQACTLYQSIRAPRFSGSHDHHPSRGSTRPHRHHILFNCFLADLLAERAGCWGAIMTPPTAAPKRGHPSSSSASALSPGRSVVVHQLVMGVRRTPRGSSAKTSP